MKKKKSFITLAIVAAVLLLGVGYALNAIDLTVNGDITISPDDSNFVVEFTDATVTGTGNTADKGDGKTATLHVESLKTVGDTLTATYTITNSSKAGLNADITTPTVQYATDTANGFYEVTSALENTTAIAPAGTKKMTVTVKLVKAPTEEVTGNFTISFKANPVAS